MKKYFESLNYLHFKRKNPTILDFSTSKAFTGLKNLPKTVKLKKLID